MTKALGVGVIGVGMLGRQHATNLAHKIPNARLVAVADVRGEVARQIGDELGAAKIYTSAQELTADPNVEAVVIVSADDAHAEAMIAAAASKKAIFCEKPIATNLADADRAIAAVQAAGVSLQIGFMRRYDPAYRAARAAVEAGKIGTPLLFKNAHRGADPAIGGDGKGGPNPAVFSNTNIHDFDDARWILGDEVTEVFASGTRIAPPGSAEGADCTVTTLKFRGGAMGDIEAVIGEGYGYDVRTEIVGDRGAIFIGSPAGTQVVVATVDGVSRPPMDHWLHRYGETYLVELQDWVDRTLSGAPSPVTGADGRAALEIAVAAQRSFAEGRVIRLPLA